MNAFHVLGGVLALWALVVAGLGIVSHGFPGGGKGEKVVMAISVLLVGSVVAAAVITSAEEKKEKDAEKAAEAAAEGEGEGGGGETAAEPAGATSVEVGMEGNKYMPMDSRVAAGGTVKWVNTDVPVHTVTKVDGPGEEFDSGEMEPGAEFEQSFPEAGTVNYVCDIHPFQKGTVTVE